MMKRPETKADRKSKLTFEQKVALVNRARDLARGGRKLAVKK